MEINQDFIAIQGLLCSLSKTTGDFTKMKYKGGNEMKMNRVIKDLEEFFEGKRYIQKRQADKLYEKELEDITFFLAINVDFNDASILDVKEFSHLVKIIPTFSKCLLANVVIELDLVEPYCSAVQKLPVQITEELLCELVPCLKKIIPELSIKYSYVIIKNLIAKLSCVDPESYKMMDIMTKLDDMILEILLNFVGLNSDQLHGWKKSRIYKVMGFALIGLLKLLQICSPDYEPLMRATIGIIDSASVIMKAVTVDVFCTWAEVQHQGDPLQLAIGEEAYHVIEKLKKFKPALELIQMMGTIAKKPRTLQDLIHAASTTTMISKIDNENTENRKRWFQALLNTSVFTNDESMSCIERNVELCSPDDVSHILQFYVDHKTAKTREITLKCASVLSVPDLVLVETRFYYRYGLKNCLGGKNVMSKLTLELNKLGPEIFPLKEIILLLLEEPLLVLSHLYKECVKSKMVFDWLSETFWHIKNLIEVEGLFLKALVETLDEIKLTMENLDNYRKLFDVICRESSSYRKVVPNIFEVYTNKYIDQDNLEDLRPMFILYKDIIKTTVENDLRTFFEISLRILEKFRWTLFDFTDIKAELCQESLKAIMQIPNRTTLLEDIPCRHLINKFYFSNSDYDNDSEFFDFICPRFPYDHQAHAISILIKVLPLCLKVEWCRITNHLILKCGEDPALQFLTDSLVLICQVVDTQDSSEQQQMFNGLKFCLQNYGIVVQSMILNLDNDALNKSVAKNICKLLKDIPNELELLEGMALVSIIPERALKKLKDDKSFVCGLAAMGNSILAQSIAKRMMS